MKSPHVLDDLQAELKRVGLQLPDELVRAAALRIERIERKERREARRERRVLADLGG